MNVYEWITSKSSSTGFKFEAGVLNAPPRSVLDTCKPSTGPLLREPLPMMSF